MSTHAMNCFDNSIPEMQGEANAFQNLELLGGFDEASASFFSRANVGVDGIQAVTATKDAAAAVSSEQYGGGEINSIYMGEQVTSDVAKAWDGTGWDKGSYSGGITMWAGFTGACDPNCGNPIISSVKGSAISSFFPGSSTSAFWDGEATGDFVPDPNYNWASNWGDTGSEDDLSWGTGVPLNPPMN